jgi:hypothetical protein
MKEEQALGVDIGNVIINNRFNDLKSLDENGYAALPVVEGSFDALKELTVHFGGKIYLISKCTEWAEKQTLAWLLTHDFYTKTGIDPQHIYFVRERSEKEGICKTVGITHFIDDRLEVLSHMIESIPYLYLFQPDPKEVEEYKVFLPKVKVVNGWSDIDIKD